MPSKEEVKRNVEALLGDMPSWDSEESKGWKKKAKEVKDKFDEKLTEKVVEPLAGAGYEGIGAALAAGLSGAAELVVPESPAELVGGTVAKAPKYIVGKGVKVIEDAKPVIKGKLAELMQERKMKKAQELIEAGGDKTAVSEAMDSVPELIGEKGSIDKISRSAK